MNIAVIGYGYWGPNLVRNFAALDGCKVVKVCDLKNDRLALVSKAYPEISTTNKVDDIYTDPTIDAVCVVTPVSLHYELAKRALEAGKHILVEKPFTASSAQAEELINLALQKNLVILVDHIFLYTGAVQKIKALVGSGEIGELQYFDSTRINLGLFQPDINVVWDLAPHDLSIVNYLVKEKPVSVIATGMAHTETGLENIAYLTINYNSNLIAHISCSWTSPVKIRQVLIGGTKKMILFDDVEPTEKVKVYDATYSITSGSDESRHDLLVDYRQGDIFIPKIDKTEALWGVVNDFKAAIENGTQPRADMYGGLEVVKLLEAAQQSIDNRGREVQLNW